LERRHGLSALADLIKNFAVRDGVHAPSVSEVGGGRRVHHSLGAIAFAVFAVALGALLQINLSCCLQSGLRRRERIPQSPHFLRNNPWLVSLQRGINERNANYGQ